MQFLSNFIEPYTIPNDLNTSTLTRKYNAAAINI
jgi:hypothetical protein